MKVRQDAWSHEDDLLLAETVLRYIREGGTQLGAFEEVGDKLNRTAAACGFRWNAEVRQKYDQAIQIAKKQRKERKRALAQAVQLQQNAPQQPLQQLNNDNSQFETEDHQMLFESSADFDDDDDLYENNASKDNMTLDSVIAFLQNIKYKGTTSDHLLKEKQRLEKEKEALLLDKEKLEKKLHRINEQNTIIQEDYQALVQIMDRARRMVPSFEDNNINQVAE